MLYRTMSVNGLLQLVSHTLFNPFRLSLMNMIVSIFRWHQWKSTAQSLDIQHWILSEILRCWCSHCLRTHYVGDSSKACSGSLHEAGHRIESRFVRAILDCRYAGKWTGRSFTQTKPHFAHIFHLPKLNFMFICFDFRFSPSPSVATLRTICKRQIQIIIGFTISIWCQLRPPPSLSTSFWFHSHYGLHSNSPQDQSIRT